MRLIIMSQCLVIAVVNVVSLLYCASGALPSNSSSETSPAITDQQQQCSTWFYWNATSHRCECGPNVKSYCSQATNHHRIFWLYCMTYDDRTDSTSEGPCPYGDFESISKHGDFIKVPKNRSLLNEAMCGKVYREGLLCSRCKRGYGPSPLSYGHACARCPNSHVGWLLYLGIALIPTTLFFLIIVICQVRTTSAPLNFFVFACQLASASVTLHPQQLGHYSEVAKNTLIGIGATFLTTWNLDFFCLLIPPFCVSENLSNLQVLSMDYIVAFYPLLLTVVMYICIQQHAMGCRFLVCLWKPFAYCFTPLARRFNWNPLTSIVPIFASFLLLSSTKMLSTSFGLLRKGQLFHMSSTGVITEHTNLPYYDPNLVFFHQNHLPYAALAFFVSVTFVIIPCLVLILYPTRLFQRFLNCCGIGCHAVHAFADAFNGCYKDGTNGTRDYRCFAGFYLFVRILILANPTVWFRSIAIHQIIFIICAFIFAFASPYKNRFFNCFDSIGLTLVSLRACITTHEYPFIFDVMILVYITVYFVFLLIRTIILKINCQYSQKLQVLVEWMCGGRPETSHTDSERQEVTETLPDRVVNPDRYRLLTKNNEQLQSLTLSLLKIPRLFQELGRYKH